MTKVCGCGCGQETPIATKTDKRTGSVKGQPLRFVHGHNSRAVERLPAGQRRPRVGWCACGCGERTSRDRQGRPRRFVAHHHQRSVADQRPLTEHECYALDLLAAVELFVGAVHDEDTPARRARLHEALSVPAPDGVDRFEALAVVLAAQVDPDLPRSARVGWADALTLPARRAG